jgi:hypothetical protein
MWFKNAEDAQYVKFGSTRDTDASVNIRFGQLKLLGCVSLYSINYTLTTGHYKNTQLFSGRMSHLFLSLL